MRLGATLVLLERKFYERLDNKTTPRNGFPARFEAFRPIACSDVAVMEQE